MGMKPPSHLSPRAKLLWDQLVPRRIDQPETITLLQAALEALDRADSARATVEVEGMTTKTLGSGAIHRHPLIGVEKEARAQFVKIWGDLNLNWTPAESQMEKSS